MQSGIPVSKNSAASASVAIVTFNLSRLDTAIYVLVKPDTGYTYALIQVMGSQIKTAAM